MAEVHYSTILIAFKVNQDSNVWKSKRLKLIPYWFSSLQQWITLCSCQ